MKKCYTLFCSFLKRIFLVFKLHVHIEAGIRRNKDSRNDGKLDVKEDTSERGFK